MADIFSLPEPQRALLRIVLQRWYDRGLKEREGVAEYLDGEAEEKDRFAERHVERIAHVERAGQSVPAHMREDLEADRGWAATNRALSAVLAALEVAFETKEQSEVASVLGAPRSITEDENTGLPCLLCERKQKRIDVHVHEGSLFVRIAEKIQSRADLRGLITILKMFAGSLPEDPKTTKKARRAST